MYKCEDCGYVFEEPKIGSEYVDNGIYRAYEACPKCSGEFSEAYECAGCGEYFYDCHLDAGFCDKCGEGIRNDFVERVEKVAVEMGPSAAKYMRQMLGEYIYEVKEALNYAS